MTTKLTFVTGLPGSGKTTYVKQRISNSVLLGTVKRTFPKLGEVVIGSCHQVGDKKVTCVGNFLSEGSTYMQGGDVFNRNMALDEAVELVLSELPADEVLVEHWLPSKRFLEHIKTRFNTEVHYISTCPTICQERRIKRAPRKSNPNPEYLRNMRPISSYIEAGFKVCNA